MTHHMMDHIHFALEIITCLILTGVWAILRQRRLRKTQGLKTHSHVHEAQLHQKDLIIREIHHRVANQMGLTAALLHLQASRSEHPEAKASLYAGESRIRTLSKLHARLHQADPKNRIILYPYLAELAHDLIASLRPDLKFHPEQANDSPSTKSSTAITCGLLVHELVTNCIKHAFPMNRHGTIRLSLNHSPPDRLRISIQDNGAGLPAGFSLENPPSSGLAIISALTKDLAGTFAAIQHQPGTEFIIEFPLSAK